MKSCPACQRTYTDETLSFCLEDGSILSAPYDPDETRLSFRPLNTDSVVTQVAYNKAQSTNPNYLQPTQQLPPETAVYSQNAPSKSEAKIDKEFWPAAIGIFVCLGLVALVALLVWSNTNTSSGSTVAARNQNSGNIPTNSNVIFQKDKKTATGFGDWNYQASMNGENLTYYPVTAPEQCQADCAKNEKCKGFTFIRPGAYNPNDSAMCYLMREVKEMVTHSCCISAVKR